MRFHHVTCICRDPNKNIRFYTQVLGLTLVKRTVNFDDPSAYHLYYGDSRGSPGSLITFFAYEDAIRGMRGSGLAGTITLAIPPGSRAKWEQQVAEHRLPGNDLVIVDPDGLRIALEEVEGKEALEIHRVELCAANMILAEHEMKKLALPADLVPLVRESRRGMMGAGSVHHIAFAVDDQEHVRKELIARGANVTEIVERIYFRSAYFRGPAGILFEIATNGPGMFVDEEQLGSGLRLPPWLEPDRERIEAELTPIGEL